MLLNVEGWREGGLRVLWGEEMGGREEWGGDRWMDGGKQLRVSEREMDCESHSKSMSGIFE